MFSGYFNRERPLSQLPLWLKLGLPVALAGQILWHGLQPAMTAKAQSLPPPLSVQAYRLISLDDPLAMAKYLNIWLQSFDDQPGISLSYQQLDYFRIIKWLNTILALDPDGQYPLLVAAHIYGSIHNAAKQRQMMDYIYQKFQQHPQKYWRWLAHAVIVAKHELKDEPLALRYADALARQSRLPGTSIPYWARDLKIITLEDMGELQAAKILVGGLLESGVIRDPYEKKFLIQKIATLKKKLQRHTTERLQNRPKK